MIPRARGASIFGFVLLSTCLVHASSTPSSTTLTVTSNGSSVSTVSSGSVVTLTAVVTAGSATLTVGQVYFCDVVSASCTDIHLVGKSQLTSSGQATIKFRPGAGSHNLQAVFVGTASVAASSSSIATLGVTGSRPTESVFATDGSSVTLYGFGQSTPTGNYSFLDQTNGNALLGSSPLHDFHQGLGFLNAASTGSANTESSSTALGDLNGDGILDIVYGDSENDSIGILLGNGDGTFTASNIALPTGEISGSVILGDFNEDGILDIAVGTFQSSDALGVWLGNGDGTFVPAPSIEPAVSSVLALGVGDFNRDGHEDLITGDGVLLGRGDGTFTPVGANSGDRSQSQIFANLFRNPHEDPTFGRSEVLGGNSFIGTQSLIVADFNGDGILDLATLSGVSLGNGDGTFSATPLPLPTSVDIVRIAAGDFNGDGILDLVSANPGSGGISSNNGSMTLLVGNGDGTFTPSTSKA